MKYVFKLNGRKVIVTEELISIMETEFPKEIKIEHVDQRLRLTAAKWLIKTFVNDQIRTSGVINWKKAAEEAIEFVIECASWSFVDSLIEISRMENAFESWGVPAEVIWLIDKNEERIAEVYTRIMHQPDFCPTRLGALLHSLEAISDTEYYLYTLGRGDEHKVNSDMFRDAAKCIEDTISGRKKSL